MAEGYEDMARQDDAASEPADPNEKIFAELLGGMELVKVNEKGKSHRNFFLYSDLMSVGYYSNIGKCFPTAARKVDINHVREMRQGYSTDVFNHREKSPKFVEKYPHERCFSIVLKNGKIINLIASSQDVRDKWMTGMQFLVDRLSKANRDEILNKWLKTKFVEADKRDWDHALEFEEANDLLKSLNVKVSRDKCLSLFYEAKPVKWNDKDCLRMDGFLRFFKIVSRRREIEDIFESYAPSREADYWTASDLLKFLKEVQKENNWSLEDCEKFISVYESVQENGENKGRFYVQGLTNFLLSPHGMTFNPKYRVVYQDMTHPITDYFIASSHNSYLTGDQLMGTSSIEGYVDCLQSGCCCLELDCWDGKDGEPVVTHGHTLTSQIHFQDVVEAVRDHGFTAKSPYPIILSLENHCSLPQQDRMAHHLKSILGDRLFVGPVTSADKVCPSPDALKGKVLVKGKKLPEEVTHDAEVDLDDQYEEEEEENLDKEKGEITTENPKKLENGEAEKAALKPKEEKKVSKALSDCVYLKAVKFRGKFELHRDGKFFEISSVSESKIMSMIEKNHQEIIDHCQRQLVRIYPKGLRITSSNYNAIPLFDSGCQIVALNYQNYNKETQIYRAKFRDNGGCGYLLKPEYMRNPGLDVALYEASRRPLILTIRVISAQQLPKPPGLKANDIIDPYVQLVSYGRDYDSKSVKTKTIRNNGWNPFWDEEFEFKLHNPDMVVLRFKVKDENTGKDALIGQHNVAVHCLQEGYRHVELYTIKNLPVELATIFVHVKKYIVP